MVASRNQISAYISEDTKKRFESYAAAHGVKKGHLIEMALLHHLQALTELPADVILPPRLVLTREGFAEVLERIEAPQGPTEAMKALFADDEL